MANEESTPETREAPIDDAVVDRTTERLDVDVETLGDALVELNAVFIGRHPELERDYDYVTVDGVRAYRVPGGVWDELSADFDFDDGLRRAVERAHTEQARLMFTDAVDVDERFDDDECGVVVGIDTAEEF